MSEEPVAAISPDATEIAPTLLFVDDEAGILSALKRIFRPFGYRIFTAESGALGLEIMEREAVDLVVSDMRMPEMNGAQFLEKVREKWPGAVRILLTGYAEIGATIEAINKGQIYRYISKPWEDNDIILAIKLALQQQQLEREKLRLEELTRKQNAELKDLNANLEEKVKVRTQQVRQAMASLEVAHENLKKAFITSVRVFSNLIEMREGKLAGHSRRVAELSRTIAQRMGMNETEIQDVFIAALLLDIGKVSLPDEILGKPFSSLNQKERHEFVKHPIKGQLALMALEQLHGAAKLIRSHSERFDGLGYPDLLAGEDIPLGARILALVNDYDAVQRGILIPSRLSQGDALAFVQKWKGTRYDPTVVETFMKVMTEGHETVQNKSELALHSRQLKPGMVISRDLVAKSGGLLLAKDRVLDEMLIEQIMNFERMGGDYLTVHVQSKQ